MRVVVVSPETSYHRAIDVTHRLERLVVGLADDGHDVTVLTTRWWDPAATDAGGGGQGPSPAPETGDRSDSTDVDGESTSPDTDDGSAATDGEREPASSAEGDDAVPSDGDDPVSAEGDDVVPPDGDDPVSAEGDDVVPPDGDDTVPAEGDDVVPPDGDDTVPTAHNRQAAVATDGATTGRDRSHPASRKWTDAPGDGGSTPADGPVRIVDDVTYRALADGPGSYRSFLTSVPGRIARTRPDVVHALASRPGTVVAARTGASMGRAPVVAEWYDATDVEADSWFVRQAVRRPDRVVVPSRLVSRQLRELGAAEDDVRVVPDAVRLADIETTNPEGGGEIVYARRLDEAANLESLLLGLAELRDYDWSAIVVGDGPARREYEQQVRDLRIDDRVTFAGECDREERIAIYRDSHVFAQTARHCPFATELLWALACGCVGIVEYHADSSAHELVEGRDRGFRTTTPQEMADAIRSAGDLDRMTVDDSFAGFDESAVVRRYLDCYESATERYGLF